MKQLKKKYEGISTILAFALVSISGFAIDVYIPSFPQMAAELHTSAANIKLTVTIFLISYGVSQLFVGSILDTFGRYRINLLSLVLFTLSCIGIATTNNIYLIFVLRLLQGILIAFIAVSKRAFFVDVYEGERRKHYTSLVTVVWATAPIIAPFVGGHLQNTFGWRSNFYFLALYGLLTLLLELKFSGETIRVRQKFHPRRILNVYSKLLSDRKFSLGIVVLGLNYAMVMVFAMSIAFIVEQRFHLTPIISGYCALASGVAILLGGLLSRRLIDKPIYKKLIVSNIAQLSVVVAMLLTAGYFHQIVPMLCFMVMIHLLQGLIYNTYFTFLLTLYPQYAATSNGLVGGGAYFLCSLFSYLVSGIVSVSDQWTLAVAYLILILAIGAILLILRKKLTRKSYLTEIKTRFIGTNYFNEIEKT